MTLLYYLFISSYLNNLFSVFCYVIIRLLLSKNIKLVLSKTKCLLFGLCVCIKIIVILMQLFTFGTL